MRKLLRFICCTFFICILLFSTIQYPSFSFAQISNNTFENTTSLLIKNFNGTNLEIVSNSNAGPKFDPGFKEKIDNMINAGETREYSTVIIVKKTAQNGHSPNQVAEMNKGKLVDVLINTHKATILYRGQALSFVTANIPLREIPKLANYDYIAMIGDGEKKIEPLSLNMDDAKFNIDIPSNLQYNGSGVRVAVVDTGIAQNLTQDLPVGTKIVAQADCTTGTCLTTGNFGDDMDHGTHNAGIIAGFGIVSSSMKGVAPGSLLLNAKIGLNIGNLGPALDWSLINKAKIANISIAAGTLDDCNKFYTTISLILDEAVDEGLVVVAAAGNSGPNPSTIRLPACSTNAITVGAVDDMDTRIQSDDNVWTNHPIGGGSSSRGPVGFNTMMKPEIVAPGVRINSTDFCTQGNAHHTPYNLLNYFRNNTCQNTPNNTPFGNFTGTSHAAPFVSGAAALVLQSHPEYSPVMVKAALLLGANWNWNSFHPNPINITASQYESNWRSYNDTLSASGFGLVDVNKTLTLANTGKNIITGSISQGEVNLYNFSANQNDQVKIVLSWLKHPLGTISHPSNEQSSNLDFTVSRSDGTIVMSSNSINQTNEFAVFNAPVTGIYTIKVSAPFVPPEVSSETFALASTVSIKTLLFKEGTFTKQPLGTTQFARPSSDTSAGGWTPTPLYSQLNEVTPNDTTYVTSPTGASPQFQVKLSNVSPPITNSGLIIIFRAESPGGSGAAEQANAVLFQGSTQIAQTGFQTLSRTSFTQFQYTLTTAEATAITDYANLSVQIQTSKASTEIIKVSWIEFDVPPPATLQQITGLNFMPKALILFTTSQTSQGSTDGYDTAMGFSNGTNSRSISVASDDNVTPSNAGRAFGTKIITILNSGTPTITAQADVSSFDSSGFTLRWTTNDGSSPIIHYIAVGGDLLTNAAVSSFSASTVSGNQAVTGLGFKPDFVMFMHAASTSDTSTSTNGYLSFGFAKPGSRAALAFDSVGNVKPTNTQEIQRTNLALVGLNPATAAINAQADLVSMDPSGFTLNWIQAPTTADKVYYLALKGGYYEIGGFGKSAHSAPVVQTINTSLVPKGLILSSFDGVASTTVQPNNTMSFGATDGVSQSTVWTGDQNGVKPTITARSVTTSKVIQMATEQATGSSSIINAEANVVSLSPNGFTLNFTTNDAIAKQLIYVAMGDKGSHPVLYHDDYSSSAGWTQIGSAITVNSPSFPGVVYFNNVVGGGSLIETRVYHQLFGLLPSSWSANFTYKYTAASSPTFLIFALTPSNTDPQDQTNYASVTDGNSVGFDVLSARGGNVTTPEISIVRNTQYYITLVKTPVLLTLEVFSDPARTMQISGSPVTVDITASGLSNLNYLQHDGCKYCGTRSITAQVDNMTIFVP